MGREKSYRGGQFIDAALWHAERAKAKEALPALLDSFGERLQFLRACYVQNAALEREGLTKVALLPLASMEAQMKATLRDVYARAFLLGKKHAGNLTSATSDEQDAVKKLRLDECQYLRNFLKDMRDAAGVMNYTDRMSMYQMAARELFWLGFVLGNRNETRTLLWQLGPTEHCADCLRFHQMGPLRMPEFTAQIVDKGYLPQSGRLACLGFHCQCYLEEVA